MNLNDYITPKNTLFFAIIFCLIVLSSVPVTRFLTDKPILIGEKPYYDLRIAKTIQEKGILFKDNLILNGRGYTLEPYHLLIVPFTYLKLPDIGLILFTIFCGLLSVLLLFLILRTSKIEIQKIFFIFLILILSPAFIFTFTTLNEFSVSIVLILTGLYLFIKSKNFFASLFAFLIASLFALINILVIILLLLILSNCNFDKKRNSNKTIITTLFVGLLYYIPSYFNSGFFNKIEILGLNSLKMIISDLGGLTGMSLFAFMLGVMGLFIIWAKRNYFKYVYFLVLLLFLSYFYFDYSTIYLTFIMSILGGLALKRLIKLRWESFFLKEFTILLLILGLLFSTISYTNRFVVSEPGKETKKALTWLDDVSGRNLVFSTYENGFWIQYWANKKTLTDSLFNSKASENGFYDTEDILHSRDLEKTKKLLDKYQIKYIFIDPTMKEGGVWNKKEGLWYLLDNNQTFKNLYQRNNVEIWEYKLSSSNRTNFIN